MTVQAVDYRKKPRFAVDLNFDGGEGFDDEPLMEYVASVNIACGGPDEPAPDDSRIPQFMTVDYVRVYQKIPTTGAEPK